MNACKIYLLFVCTIIYSTQYFVSSKETWEKVKASGYPLQMYSYQSEDKVMLGMERIPFSKYGNKTIGKPVILLSGMFATSIVYVSHNRSLGYLLSDAGFDVWLFNWRGTGMSRKIVDPRTGRVPTLDEINWDYCFHEFGVYDLPAAIDLVISVTGYSKVDVGGVSLGGSVPLIMLSERPEYNEKIRNLILMAPASRMHSGYTGIQYYFLRKAVQAFLKANLRIKYVSLNKDPDHVAAGELCKNKLLGLICLHSLNILQGFYNPLQMDTVIDVFTTYPQPTSLKSIKHYLQLLLSGRFSNYDYGAVGNLLHYDVINPPEYNMSKITAPAIIMYSKKDNLVPPKDIQYLLDTMPNIKDTLYIDNVPFSHQSFAMGKNAHLIVGPYIIKQLRKD